MTNLDLTLYLTCLAIFACACFLQGLVGFGMGVIASPLLLIVEPRLMPGGVIFIGVVLALITTIQYRTSLSLAMLKSAFVGRILGTFLAAYILMIISQAHLAIILGLSVLFVVMLTLTKWQLMPTQINLFFGGMLSGIMGTATGIGGPPLAILLQNEDPDVLKANLAAFFTITGLVSLAALYFAGRFDLADVQVSLTMLPAPIVATYFAYKWHSKVKPQYIRYAVLVLCSISAIISLSEGIHML